MKFSRMAISIMLFATMVLGNFSVFGAGTDQEEYEIFSGKLTLNIVFDTEEESELYKESLSNAAQIGVAYIKNLIAESTDLDKIAYLKEGLEATESIDIDSLFKLRDDNRMELEVPFPNTEIDVDGTQYITDENGEFEISVKKTEESTATVSKNGAVLKLSDDIKEEMANNDNNIKIERTLSDLGIGIERMGKNMEAEAQGIQLYPTVTPSNNTTHTYLGAGVGMSEVFRYTNIVGCNKHDTSTASITATQFALQNSDCSVSVKLGLLITTTVGSVTNALFSNSVFCVAEAVTNANNTRENIYCNGNLKGSHTNCSWFFGIGHTESFHTHN